MAKIKLIRKRTGEIVPVSQRTYDMMVNSGSFKRDYELAEEVALILKKDLHNDNLVDVTEIKPAKCCKETEGECKETCNQEKAPEPPKAKADQKPEQPKEPKLKPKRIRKKKEPKK